MYNSGFRLRRRSEFVVFGICVVICRYAMYRVLTKSKLKKKVIKYAAEDLLILSTFSA